MLTADVLFKSLALWIPEPPLTGHAKFCDNIAMETAELCTHFGITNSNSFQPPSACDIGY